MPAKVAQKLVDSKAARNYLKGKKRDIHEKDLGHLLAAEKAYLEIAKRFSYPVIECYEDGHVLTREEIAERVRSMIKKQLKI